MTEALTDAQQADVEAGLKNGAVSLGLKLHVGEVCTPGDEASMCPVRLCLGLELTHQRRLNSPLSLRAGQMLLPRRS